MNIDKIISDYGSRVAKRGEYPFQALPEEMTMPVVIVGRKVNVVHTYTDEYYMDLVCGDTTVVEIKRTGSFKLANGFMFYENGLGQAKNKNCRASLKSVHPWNDRTLSYEDRDKLGFALNPNWVGLDDMDRRMESSK